MSTAFPIDLSAYKPLKLDPTAGTLTAEQKVDLQANIQLMRDAMVFFTAIADAKGLGGHTGGPFDIVPEVAIADAFFRFAPEQFVPIFFDEAGHRVAIQYLMSVLHGHMPAEKLLHHREHGHHLPGHPERDFTPGVAFSSGRLGHMWPMVNGVAMAEEGKTVFMLGSDGSQMEGDDAEAARLAVAQQLNVKLLIDDNDVTIAGFPSEYMKGYSVRRTLEGHGLVCTEGDGEDVDDLFARMCQAVATTGPVGLINKRKMCVGIEGLEGSNHGHDVIKCAKAIEYLEKRGLQDAAGYLKTVAKLPGQREHAGVQWPPSCKNRDAFGAILSDILDEMSPEKRKESVRVIDCDLEGSCGLHHVAKRHPEVFVRAGIMERGNFAAAAGFGFEKGRQGVFGTFSAFLEMILSEVTMARLNKCNALAHFSHAGCDDMADNTCHFGINNMFAANGLEDEGKDTTRLYFPADGLQFEKCLRTIFPQEGLRFVFSTRSAVPVILDEAGTALFDEGYTFVPGKDDLVREAGEGEGYILSFGETLYRAVDAAVQLKAEGRQVGVVNKSTLNIMDEDMMARLVKAPYVLVAESFNTQTGLGMRFGTELLKRGFKGAYQHIGTNREGNGGLWEHMGWQGVDADGIVKTVKALQG